MVSARHLVGRCPGARLLKGESQKHLWVTDLCGSLGGLTIDFDEFNWFNATVTERDSVNVL